MKSENSVRPNSAPSITDVKTLALHKHEIAELHRFREGEPRPALVLHPGAGTTSKRAFDHFGFKWVARPRPTAKFKKFFYIEERVGRPVRVEGMCPYVGAAFRDILPENEGLRSKAAELSGLPAEALDFYYVSTDTEQEAYLRGKQQKAITDLNLESGRVKEIGGTMIETRSGEFFVLIDKVMLEDHSVVPYSDPDSSRISRGI